ncbi:cholinesterase 1-like [Diadema antillarum]|uniref:cholinesterase 1-like n=1 Tax=Diadema antillarum TaxID=105358 RepID=UPI003A87F4A2
MAATRILSFALAITFFVCLLHLSSASIGERQPIVQAGKATFRGKFIDVRSHHLPDFSEEVAAFTGIPYAEPPVDERRFKRPMAKVLEGDFDATRTDIFCAQTILPILDINFEGPQTEDCLVLDVYVPQPQPRSVAVMVWIHGGGFQSWAGSIPTLLPIPLAALNDVIVVTLNYRLSIFGFLTTGDDVIPGNLGLLDQRQALIWVQENIAAFGGDPTRVTIFGESAGGASVNLHVLSPMSAGLFSGAIMQSGVACDWASGTTEEAREKAFTLGSALNCDAVTSEELLECLNSKSVDEIVDFLAGVFDINTSTWKGAADNHQLWRGTVREGVKRAEAARHVHQINKRARRKARDMFFAAEIMSRPVVDGQFIPRIPFDMAADGEFNRVDTMIGYLSDEGNVFVLPQHRGLGGNIKPLMNKTVMQDALSLNLLLGDGGVDQQVIDAITFVYSTADELSDADRNYFDMVAEQLGDNYFLCPSFVMAEYLSARGNAVYMYVMSHVPSHSFWGKDITWMGATHVDDLQFVMGSALTVDPDDDIVGFGKTKFTDEEARISVQTMKYWSNFAKTRNPNLSSVDGNDEVGSLYPPWPKFNKEKVAYKDISLSFENHVGHPKADTCFFNDNILPQLRANAAEIQRLRSLVGEGDNQ